MIEISWEEHLQLPMEVKRLQSILQQFLNDLGHEKRHLIVYLTEDATIQTLNRQYRNRDKPTDVLSWSYWEDNPDSDTLGEIAISLERTYAQALQNGWDPETELIRLLAHGCVHLAGYDHERSAEEEKQMLGVEIALLKKVGLETVYLGEEPKTDI